MPTFVVIINGDREIDRRMMQLIKGASGPQSVVALEAGAMIIVNDAKARAPFLTGTLRRSIHHERGNVSANQAEVLIGPSVNYGAQVEFGGDIVPKRARFLRFVIDGQVIYTRHVHQEPRPYLVPAAQDNTDAVVREVGDVLRQLLEIT